MKKVFILWFFAYLGVFSYTYSQTVYVPGGNAGILDSNNSNVGVGIASPTEKIHMLGNLKLDGHAGIIFNTPDASDPYNYIAFKVQDERKWLIDYGTVQTNNLRFLRFSGGQFKTFLNLDYDNLEVELLDVNVGIGLSNPSHKLHVAGDMMVSRLGSIGLVSKIMARGTMSGSTNTITAVLRSGTGDGASFGSWNGGLSSWFGIGFHSDFDNTTRGIFNTRNGDFSIKGEFSSEGSGSNYFEGNVGIGTTNPGTFKLAVNGNIRAKEIKVETGWSDFVFEDDYDLRTLEEVEGFIKTNKHLPEIPSAKEVKENGVELGEMDSKLLQKIEELTLYIIDQEKRIKKLEAINSQLMKEKKK